MKPVAPCYWLNGRLVDSAQAVLPLTDHGLLYGDGVFEGIRFYQRTPFRLDPHLARFEASARALALTLPLSRAELCAAVTEVIAAYGADAGYLRLVATRGSGGLGLDPGLCPQPNLFLIADGVAVVGGEQRQHGITLITAAVRRPASDVLDPRIKSLNYLNNILAKLEARHAGADEAVLLNNRGTVAEATAENLFIAQGGQLYTPPVIDGALAGITRAAVMEVAKQSGLNVSERSLAPYDLYTADECFLCGTGAELIPVRSIDGRPLPAAPGPLFRQVAEAFVALIAQECRQP